jgi:hypothetical protein
MIPEINASGTATAQRSASASGSGNAYASIQQQFLSGGGMAENNPAPAIGGDEFGSVRVGGDVVARIANDGSVSWVSSAWRDQLSPVTGPDGPGLARTQAERIAGLTGGKVEISASAMSQSAYDKMKREAASASADGAISTAYMAQQAAAEPGRSDKNHPADLDDDYSDAEEIFLEFVNMTPMERYIEQAIRARGYSREEFEALPPEKQQEILEEIRAEFREKVEDPATAGNEADSEPRSIETAGATDGLAQPGQIEGIAAPVSSGKSRDAVEQPKSIDEAALQLAPSNRDEDRLERQV